MFLISKLPFDKNPITIKNTFPSVRFGNVSVAIGLSLAPKTIYAMYTLGLVQQWSQPQLRKAVIGDDGYWSR